MNHPRRPRPAVLALAAFAIAITTAGLGFCQNAEKPASKSPDYRELRVFRQVLDIVNRNYVRDVSEQQLIQGAINGMLQSLDPHSSYLTEEMYNEFKSELASHFGGLGIEITVENGVLTVVSPVEDTPAFKAGLKPGDKIVKIDGETTRNITLLAAVKKLRGREGTKVTISVMREGWRKAQEFALTRDIIHVHSVKKEIIEPGYAYARVANFQESTTRDLSRAIKEMGREHRIEGFVLDLRYNPGGLLDQAVKVAQLFVKKGLIVYTDGRAKDQRLEYKAATSDRQFKFKMAVLVNEGSASASEIVAGALQDHDRALVLGSKTFGKASVQTIIPMEDGSGLRLTTAFYYTPKGRHIQQTGIIPDMDLKAEVQKQQDEEAAKTDKQLGEKDTESKLRYPRPILDLEKDMVLQKALEWLKSDVTVKQYKEEHRPKDVAETASTAPATE
jgi:carboxyl-terminal processing protease